MDAWCDSNFILEFDRQTLKNMVMESPKSLQNGTLKISRKVSNLLLQSFHDASIKEKSIVSSYNIGSVLGVNHYFSREQELYAKIHSIKKEKDEAMQHGIDMEPVVAQMFADAYCVELYKSPLVISKESPYVCALSDRLTHHGFNVEIKVPMWRAVAMDFDLEDLMTKMPEYYHQMQLQMHVLNLDNTWFVQYGGPPNKYHTKSTTKNTDAFHKQLNNNSLQHIECEVLSAIIVPREVDWWKKHEKEILSFVDEVLDGKNKIKQQEMKK
jgi:putative phage-type endonuclease